MLLPMKLKVERVKYRYLHKQLHKVRTTGSATQAMYTDAAESLRVAQSNANRTGLPIVRYEAVEIIYPEPQTPSR